MGRLLVRGEPGNAIIDELRAARRARSSSTSPARACSTTTASTRCCAERGITHLVFAGVTTEVCVQTSMREANDRGFECLLIEDATESYFPRVQGGDPGHDHARRAAIVGWVTPLATLEEGSRPVSDASKESLLTPRRSSTPWRPLLGIDRRRRNSRPASSRISKPPSGSLAWCWPAPLDEREEPAAVFVP